MYSACRASQERRVRRLLKSVDPSCILYSGNETDDECYIWWPASKKMCSVSLSRFANAIETAKQPRAILSAAVDYYVKETKQ
jgi:hypothetical protein